MKVIVFGFGRMNPPTNGHELLANKIDEVASKHPGSRPILFVSPGQESGTEKNPLSYERKYHYAKLAFPKVVQQRPASIRNAFEALNHFVKNGSTSVIYVHGDDQDQVELRDKLAKEAARLWGEGYEFSFGYVTLERSGNAQQTASATKARAMAKKGDFQGFVRMMPSKLKPQMQEVANLYAELRKVLV